jgi:CMP-N-acetylneuraminic acid synthetase
MKNIALMTARAGSQSVPNKNILPCTAKHVPMFLSNLDAASKCDRIHHTYTCSDIPLVKAFQPQYDYTCLFRPPPLCGADIDHYSVMRYGVDAILHEHPDVDNIVLLLGNNCGCTSANLDLAIRDLEDNMDYDSVMSVGLFNQFNPYRAFTSPDPSGEMQPFLHEDMFPKNANDKNACGDFYFFNGSFWVVKVDVFLANEGHPPYPWLGNKIKGYILDSHVQEIDSTWQYNLVTEFSNLQQ